MTPDEQTNPKSFSTSKDSPEATSSPVAEARHRLEEGYRDIERQYDDTRHQLQEFNERAVVFIRENPGWCILGAVAAGYVIGRMASRRWLA